MSKSVTKQSVVEGAGKAAGADRPPSSTAPRGVTRREALGLVTALMGGVALTGCSKSLTGLALANAPQTRIEQAANAPFTAQEVALLDEIADTILPETDTPGAKAAAVGPFMALMVADTYTSEEQATFRAGMRTLEAACVTANGTGFVTATPEERLALLQLLDLQQHEANKAREAANKERAEADKDHSKHYFRMMKELALLGYFTSEVGAKQALRYLETPGSYDPCTPYHGEPAWA